MTCNGCLPPVPDAPSATQPLQLLTAVLCGQELPSPSFSNNKTANTGRLFRLPVAQRSLQERPQQLVLLPVLVQNEVGLMHLQKREPCRHCKHRPLLAPELIPDVRLLHLLCMGILKVGIHLQYTLRHLTAEATELRVPQLIVSRAKQQVVLHLVIQVAQVLRHELGRRGVLCTGLNPLRCFKCAKTIASANTLGNWAVAHILHRPPEKIALAMAPDHCQGQPILLIHQVRHLRPQ
mmetsp:Transcript_72401/g.166096  ORF Transcript_72401/g.166096 Transcript_72401/m.166096 type:complete len:236 (-) Transcript_72401:106-813(-)